MLAMAVADGWESTSSEHTIKNPLVLLYFLKSLRENLISPVAFVLVHCKLLMLLEVVEVACVQKKVQK
jgi:hypothetical protein